MARLAFAREMLRARLDRQRRVCPYCDSRFHTRLQRKWILVEARKCEFCGLVFRWPLDRGEQARRYYEESYEGQQATEVPAPADLSRLLEHGFAGTPHDKSSRVQTLGEIVPGGRLLDFGCSWGYAMVQWRAAGFDPVGFELARDRAEFARRELHLDVRQELDELAREPDGSFDAICADHVLEHLPRLRDAVCLFSRLLRDDGVLLVFVPNGGGTIARRLGTRWRALIGESHTIAFTAEWFERNLPRHGLVPRCSSNPDRDPLCDGEELVCVARRDRTEYR